MRKCGLLGVVVAALAAGVLHWQFFGPRRPADQGPCDPATENCKNRPLPPRPVEAEAGTCRTVAASPLPELSPQEKYDAALLDALNLLAEHRYAQALASLETARGFQDTEQIRREIDKVKARIEQEAAAERTVRDLQTVLRDGKAQEAARLAAAALQQYGGTDQLGPLDQLKRQADALAAALLDDRGVHRGRFHAELDVALREKDLRGAAIALEQLLRYEDEAPLRRQLEDLRATLARYDECRQRAATLRRDPTNLEEAIAALQEAARAWDTLQVRQEIDNYTLALQKRRYRLGVADFEVLGDVGMAAAGRTVAEELLPTFKVRFDLVERSQLGKVFDELKLETCDLTGNDGGQREVGRLAKLRYLVVGSVTRLSQITVNARLIDVHTGLVVQTAKVTAPSPEEVLRLLPQLANVLMMSDEQKMAYELQLARQAAAEVVPVTLAPLPPPPEPPAADQALPPPVVACTCRPPECGGVRAADFERLPSQPPPAPVIVVERENRVKSRLLRIAVQLGDNLFRRGCYREAHVQFEFALNLSPRRKELRLRLERCRPLVPAAPPPPVVVVALPPPPRPRIAVLNFVVNADPSLAPPGFGDWAAQHVACQLSPAYEVVDRGEVFWYMGRLGLTVRDVLTDAAARRWLGRALNVRFFVFGVIQQTASFNVTTHLVDAESGVRQGTGQVHVKDQHELKLRMSELAGQALKSPVERQHLQRQAQENERLLNQARQLCQAGQSAQAVTFCQSALKQHPENVALRALLEQAQRQVRQTALEQQRQREFQARQALVVAARQRQQKLAQEAQVARVRAEQEARARQGDARRALELQRQRAHEQLLLQGQRALQQRHYQQAVQLLESAVAMKPSVAGSTALAQAKAQADAATRIRIVQERARLDREQRLKREAELAPSRARVAEEKRRQEAEAEVRRKAQQARDEAAYARLLGAGKKQLAQQQYEAALTTLQTARRLNRTAEVERLIGQAQAQQTRRSEEEQRRARFRKLIDSGRARLASRQYDAAVEALSEAVKMNPADAGAQAALRAAQTAQAAAATAAHHQAEARKKAELYQKCLAEGRRALSTKHYEAAIKAFGEALQLQPGDPTATRLLKEADRARAGAGVQARKREEERQRVVEVQKLLTQGRAALAAHDLNRAARAVDAAARLAPHDPAVLQAQQEVQKGRDAARVGASARDKRHGEFQAVLQKGRQELAAKRFNEAVKAFAEACRLSPNDSTAQDLLRQAEKGREEARLAADSAAKKKAEDQRLDRARRQASYQEALRAGRTALAAKRYDEAVKSFTEAGRLMPTEPEAAALLRETVKQRSEAQATAAAAARNKQEEQRRLADFNRLLIQGQTALAGKRYEEAVKAFRAALQLQPTNATAAAALRQAQQALDAARAPRPAPPAVKPPPQPKTAPSSVPAPPKVGPQPKPAARITPVVPPQPPNAQLEYLKQMQWATVLEKQQQYGAAIQAYKTALLFIPRDARATAALKNAEFALHLTEGQKAMATKRFPDAVREFEMAVKLVPTNPVANAALKQARQGHP